MQLSVWRSREDEQPYQSRQKSPAKCLHHLAFVVIFCPPACQPEPGWPPSSRLGLANIVPGWVITLWGSFWPFSWVSGLDRMAAIKVILSRWNVSRKQSLAQVLTCSWHPRPWGTMPLWRGKIDPHTHTKKKKKTTSTQKENRLYYLSWLLLSMF